MSSLTKKELSELIQELKGGGDQGPSTKYHDTVVWKVADICQATVVTIAFRENQKLGGYDVNGDWISTFENVPVCFSENRNEYYSDLPAGIISLPNNRGLRMVSPMGNQADKFNIDRSGGDALWAELEAGSEGSDVYIEGSKLFYRNLSKFIAKNGVLVKMVRNISGLDEDDLIPIPSGYEEMFLAKVMDLFSESKATLDDDTNDGRSQEINVR